mgnify:CR=1 FL=1
MDSTLKKQGVKSALAELRSATGGLQTVLFIVCRLKPLKTLTFFTCCTQITSTVTSKIGIFLVAQLFRNLFVPGIPISI